MAERQLYVRKAEKLSLRYGNIVVAKNEDTIITVPLEDVAFILLEDPFTSITTRLLSELAENYVALITCSDRYEPVSITLPLNMHYKQLKTFKMQLDVKKPTLSQVWKNLVKGKILNQQSILWNSHRSEEYDGLFDAILDDVKSNDNTNREAYAARLYFKMLYGGFFSRRQESSDPINSALNYGYTIFISQMTRLLIMYGFNTNIGVFHKSMSNNFNLSCDLVEPFRPIIDQYVKDHLEFLEYPLSTEIRKGLIDLLNADIAIDDQNFIVQHAMEELVLSYIKVLNEEDSSQLKIPKIRRNEE